MDRDALWRLFFRTGNTVFYVLYKELEREKNAEKTA